LLHLVRNSRTGAHQRHVAADDIPHLRQFVQRKAPEVTTDRRQARGVRDFERDFLAVQMRQRTLEFLRVGHHRAELVADETPPAEPATLLAEDGRPPRHAGARRDRRRCSARG
jgi:hypothetical protein